MLRAQALGWVRPGLPPEALPRLPQEKHKIMAESAASRKGTYF